MLEQRTILQNLILTGLRGLGKTVLMETFKPMAIRAGWLWAGTDLSESTSITEANLATRLLTDLSVVTSSIPVHVEERRRMGFTSETDQVVVTLNFSFLNSLYEITPGLVADKLKKVLEVVWSQLQKFDKRGIIFAYDEAQNLSDHSEKGQFPLSLLLDVFQSIQRKDIPFMLVLTGLPTLFPKLVEARTYSERMFHVIFLNPLSRAETDQAVRKPIVDRKCQVCFLDTFAIWEISRGYPYFVQYVCREVFDIWIQNMDAGQPPAIVPTAELIRKLDTDFFAGRWARATDRQRELLGVVARLDNCDAEFTVQDVAEHPANLSSKRPFSSSHINQMLVSLTEAGLVYKNRHGKYSFAVPLLSGFIRRQLQENPHE